MSLLRMCPLVDSDVSTYQSNCPPGAVFAILSGKTSSMQNTGHLALLLTPPLESYNTCALMVCMVRDDSQVYMHVGGNLYARQAKGCDHKNTRVTKDWHGNNSPMYLINCHQNPVRSAPVSSGKDPR